MILVPNRRQLLSGSRFYLLIAVLLLSACAKKTAPVVTGPPRESAPVKDQPAKEVAPAEIRKSSVALLLPFHLDKIDLKTAERKSIEQADLAIEFYHGFKLALDSLAAGGDNFKLQVFDSQEEELQIVNLARAGSVMNNDLIVGPIFPESIKTFSEFANLGDKVQVSPLAASPASLFKNQRLVSLTNSIDQHAWKMADYINRNYKPNRVNVVLINTRSTENEKFAAPFKKMLGDLASNQFFISERPNAISLENFLSATKLNLVIIVPDNRDFLLPTIDRLYKESKTGKKIEVFGHPNWARAQFLDSEKMQWLNTHITSSYYVDYSSARVKNFVARYRDDYGFDPTEYSFKGFDTGFFFGKLLTRFGADYAKHITDENYNGLHNDFRFVQDPESGFLNTDLMMLKYQGFELKVVK